MAMSTYCCLNSSPAPPSTPISSPNSRKPQAIARPPSDRSWKNQCFLGLTCAIIGLELGNFAIIGDQERAMAMDMQSGPSKMMIRAPTWSEKRTCQPWRVNSLETIVPENLPRPSARRRWEATGLSEAAPPVKVVIISGAKSCFNL